MQNALLVLSDSGSIQQEVIALKKKCVRLKASPSFPEVLTYKGIITVPPNKQNILQAVRHLAAPQIQNSIQSFESPLGEGNASEKIVHEISEHINDLKSETIFWRREFHMP
jgi:UDP-N-acetylglucosamine 2-epimerase